MADGLFGETTMNLAEIFVLCGFFLIFAVEEVTHVLLDKCCKNGKGQVRLSLAGSKNGKMQSLDSTFI
jgi:hypothetical protein